jgi:eukaryotic-like serine/threonine-protein kinase
LGEDIEQMTGQRLGPYAVLGKLGEGGMGEVYRARDTVLNRDVAIKMLPAPLALDPDRMARLRREAQLLASLNHPNIAQIHGLEQAGETLALVMELVDGPTLADLVARGPMPLDDVLPIARQVADALIAAHEQGIIHRDLKPANIKVRSDGVVKVLDFGLAKSVGDVAVEGSSHAGAVTVSPTITSPAMTQAGVILGTAAYMSPEQAKGRPADKRSDVWAFGCIVYEMLTGKRAFAGDDVGDTLAAVIRGEPDWTALPPNLPRPLRAFIQGCLEKDRARRIGHISTARFVLDERTIETSSDAPAEPRRPSVMRRLLPLMATAVVVVAATSAAWWWQRPSLPAQRVARFSFSLPTGQQFTEGGLTPFAISRDGTQIAYLANRRFFLRSIAESEARPVPGSEAERDVVISGAVFSPDGRSIAFWTGSDPTTGALKKIAVTGGTPVVICETGFPLGLTWDASGILFGQPGAGVMRVSENGGQPQLLVPAKDGVVWRPQMLPGGNEVLFTVADATAFSGGPEAWDNARIVVHSLQTGEQTTLPHKGTDASYLPTGHIVYASGGSLFAVPFDVTRRQIAGGAVPVVDRIQRVSLGSTTLGTAYYSVSDSGSMIFVSNPRGPAVARDLAFVDRKGAIESLRLRPAEFRFPRVDPDGKRVAVEVGGVREANIWIYDLTGHASPQQLTNGGRNRFPVWSRDGQRVLFQSDRDGDLAIFWQRADGSSTPERLTKPDKGFAHLPRSSSNDGKTVLFNAITPVERGTGLSKGSLFVLTLPDGTVQPFSDVQGSARTINAVFSPDDRWVAYDFGETLLQPVLYVQPFPPTGAKYRVAMGGSPVWSHDGRQLYFGGEGPIRFQTVISTQPFTLGNPTEQPRPGFITSANDPARTFDIMPDGRIIGVVAAGETTSDASAAPQIQVVVNWFEELKRRAPAP